MKIYLASSLDEDKRENIEKAKKILLDKGFEVYVPFEHKISHAWEYPNSEWGLMVFENDLQAIEGADLIVGLTYGRKDTGGVNWEFGYCYGIGKKVLLVEMSDNIMSLMVGNGRYATVKGLEELEQYDFRNLPMTRTKTEVM